MLPSQKKHYSAAELAALKLPGMPATSEGMRKRAKKEQWPVTAIKSRGYGGLSESFTPPVEIQNLIRARESQALIASVAELPVPESAALATAADKALIELTRRQVDSQQLTDAQRRCSAARCAICAHVLEHAVMLGNSHAVAHVVEAARTGQLPAHLQVLVGVANARSSDNTRLSRTRLYEWLGLYLKAQTPADRLRWLAPVVPQKDMTLPPWAGLFLQLFRKPSRPQISEVRKAMLQELGEHTPSVDQLRRFVKKLPPEVIYRGRMTGAELKAKLPFVRRGTEHLKPNDVWMGDGHGFKALVQHPEHSRAFRPEVTLIMDVASRVIVGWSVSLSESCIAVSDALRHGMTHYPVPGTYYSDNGGGQTNKTFDEPVVGVLSRLGIAHELGRPGNPQGRGMVERLHQTVLIKLANQLGTSQTSRMDRDTLRLVTRNIQGGQTALDNGRKPSDKQQAALNKLPSWREFIDALKAAIDDYNQHHEHRSLPKVNGKHMTPQQYYELHVDNTLSRRLDANELCELFRPMVIRKATRGEVRLLSSIYYHRDLMLVDGENVQVSYDIHDARTVIVRDMNGRFVCEAEFDGNKEGFFPKAEIDRRREASVDRAVARLQKQIDEKELGRRTTLNLTSEPASPLLTDLNSVVNTGLINNGITRVLTAAEQDAQRVHAELLAEMTAPKVETFTLPADMESRYRLWLKLDARVQAGDDMGERETNFWRSFARTTEWAVQKQMFEDFGLAAEG